MVRRGSVTKPVAVRETEKLKPILAGLGIFVLVWLALILAFAAQLVFGASFPWNAAIRTSALDWLPWVVLSPLVCWLAFRFPLERGKLATNIPLHLLACFLVVTACGWLVDTLAPRPVPGPGPRAEARRAARDFPPPNREGLPPPPLEAVRRARDLNRRAIWATVALTRSKLNVPVYWVIVSAAHALALYRRVQERDRRALELTAGLSQAKLQALRLQLQPHFLFNTLNAIATLVHRDADAADEMITHLSELLRVSLEVSDQEVTLGREMELLDHYLAIERTRLGDRMQVRKEIDLAVMDALVPALMLQTLVENAVRHGIEPRAGPGTVVIKAAREGDRLSITIEDNGAGLKLVGSQTGRRGIGLANSESRLRELYGDHGRITLREPPSGGLAVELEIPWRRVASTVSS